MKIAVVSEDFRSVTGKAGKARRFLLFEAQRGRRPQLQRYLQLPEDLPTYHDLHSDARVCVCSTAFWGGCHGMTMCR